MANRLHSQPPVEPPALGAGVLADRCSRFPIGASITLVDLEDHQRGTEVLHELRKHEPVTWLDALGGWLVTPRPLVEEVLSSHERFTVYAKPSLVRAVLGHHMLSVEGDVHRHHRAPYDPPLRLRPVRESCTGLVTDIADDLLNALPSRGGAELRSQYANPLAITVAARLLGLSFSDISRMSEIYDCFAEAMVDYDDPAVEESTAAMRTELDEIIGENITRLRCEPDGSVISRVINDAAAEQCQATADVIANTRIILFGAIETVTSCILSTTWALLTHDTQLQAAIADPTLFGKAVDEALRWAPPVGFSERWAAIDTELAGVAIGAGEMMIPSLAAANRDPEWFEDPDRFDIHRANARHHSAFSHGEHHCIGFNVANLEARIAVERLFGRWPRMQLDSAWPAAPVGFGFRSPPQLHVVLG